MFFVDLKLDEDLGQWILGGASGVGVNLPVDSPMWDEGSPGTGHVCGGLDLFHGGKSGFFSAYSNIVGFAICALT